MADPAELIPTHKAVWLLRHLNCCVEDGSIMLAKSALAALTTQPSADDDALISEGFNACRDIVWKGRE